jgi:hypothetical protein
LDPPEYSSLAMAAAATGRIDYALAYAKRSIEVHELLAGAIFLGRAFEVLRAHPRFAELRTLRDGRATP